MYARVTPSQFTPTLIGWVEPRLGSSWTSKFGEQTPYHKIITAQNESLYKSKTNQKIWPIQLHKFENKHGIKSSRLKTQICTNQKQVVCFVRTPSGTEHLLMIWARNKAATRSGTGIYIPVPGASCWSRFQKHKHENATKTNGHSQKQHSLSGTQLTWATG